VNKCSKPLPLTTAMITMDRVKSPQRRCMGLFLAARAMVLILNRPDGAITSGRRGATGAVEDENCSEKVMDEKSLFATGSVNREFCRVSTRGQNCRFFARFQLVIFPPGDIDRRVPSKVLV